MSAAVWDRAGTRERIIAAGLRLFADRRVRGTTVGQIEKAAGLTPRSGALYKHFGSKEAVLEAAVERGVRDLEAIYSAIESFRLATCERSSPSSPAGLHVLAEQRDLGRIDRFLDLERRFQERIVDWAYAEAVTFIERKVDSGELGDVDRGGAWRR
jgi:AcrR family transcriptional regulator